MYRLNGICGSLIILASGKHDDVGGRSLCRDGLFSRGFPRGDLFEELLAGRDDAGHVTSQIRESRAKETLSRFRQKIRFLERPLDALPKVSANQPRSWVFGTYS
jgi:hypothetical protein